MHPEDWKEVLLDNVAKRGSGHTPNKDFPEYWHGGIKWVSLADSSRLDKGLIAETDKEISVEGLLHSSAVMHPLGTVILSRDAGVGKSGVLASDMAVSQHFIAWDCSTSTELHNWYLYYWLQQRKPEFERVAVGSTIKTIGLPYFKKIKITLPPLREQNRIAEALSTWDQAIATTELLLANAAIQRKALTNRLFIHGRHSDITTHGWRFADLDEFFERVTRRNTIANSNVLTISGTRGLVSQRDYFNKSVASENLSGYTLLERGEFAYNKSYSAGYPMGAIKPLTSHDQGVVSSLYICFRLRDEVEADADFFRHYFETGMLNEGLSGIAQEGARNHGLLNVGVSDFFKLRLHIPDVTEQRRIADILNMAEQKELLIAAQLDKLRDEKKALMSQLLTGKRRVRLPADEAVSA
ncbi:restriction endonuclease subunit S [Xanthomonas graminis]|uniref:restriction endonuclease subunit S n=1 Tax=Xanthomonas graminis TaxID=3390026 RepID=UPI001F491904|nr:restriction endonuclease subunit S [Xanthomonas translucens]UKE73925.1 restriction endonuclease subunit S [Xanthomonas translucens pv. phleipratensis]